MKCPNDNDVTPTISILHVCYLHSILVNEHDYTYMVMTYWNVII